ncbi:MAG: L-threonylcarbamoyladenylate synthase [Nanoarchaeota archaeon]
MEVYTPSEVKIYLDDLMGKIKGGKLFIHPTDTIYGIGCNAMKEEAVKKLREAKRQMTRPFSVMVPNKSWIFENCIITPEAEEWIEKLPGPYTLILNLKHKNSVAPSVTLGSETIGVRIPNHWFCEVIEKIGQPIITTSANITGENFITRKEELDETIKMKCDFIIDEGVKKGMPSTIIDLSSEDIDIKKRNS